jgi:hypothetical protein
MMTWSCEAKAMDVLNHQRFNLIIVAAHSTVMKLRDLPNEILMKILTLVLMKFSVVIEKLSSDLWTGEPESLTTSFQTLQ